MNLKNLDSAYKIVLIVDDTDYINLDFVNKYGSTGSIDIFTHPLITGDIVADHIVRQPKTATITGKFSSLQEANYTDFSNFETSSSSSNRLTNIQAYFENVRDKALFVTICMINENEEEQFISEKNLVLKSFTLDKSQTTADFTMQFQEILLVQNFSNDYNINENEIDPNLPSITDPSTASFTQTLLNVEDVVKYVVKVYYDATIIESEFLYGLVEYCKNAFPKTGAQWGGLAVTTGAVLIGSVVLATTIVKGLIAIGVASSTAGPVGWIVGAAVALVALIGIAIAKSVNAAKRAKYKIKQFHYYKDNTAKSESEYNRFLTHLDDVTKSLTALDDYITVYSITYNGVQECSIDINNNYYWLSFEKDNAISSGCKWRVSVKEAYTANEDTVASKRLTYLSDMSEASLSTALYVDNSKYQIFIFIKANCIYDIDGNSITPTDEQLNDLTNYYIVVTNLDMNKWNKTLQAVIKDAIEA